MKIYLLELDRDVGQLALLGKLSSVVVCASSENEARRLAAREAAGPPFKRNEKLDLTRPECAAWMDEATAHIYELDPSKFGSTVLCTHYEPE